MKDKFRQEISLGDHIVYAKSTRESQVKRDLFTPKYKMRVEVDQKKESKVKSDEELYELEDLCTCPHGFLAGCPKCTQKATK